MTFLAVLEALPGRGLWLADAWISLFSLLGFLLAPGSLGKALWILPLWFGALNLWLLLAPVPLHPGQNPAVALALIHFPWVAFCVRLARGKAGDLIAAVPLQAMLLWSVYRFAGLQSLLALRVGELPVAFAVETASGEMMTGLGALSLWVLYGQSHRGWFRALLLFWNAYGLTAALALALRMALANPDLPFLRLSPDIHRHFTAMPQSWMAFFWLPLAIALHVSVFYKLYLEWNASTRPEPAALS
jgi:hypothetical protein